MDKNDFLPRLTVCLNDASSLIMMQLIKLLGSSQNMELRCQSTGFMYVYVHPSKMFTGSGEATVYTVGYEYYDGLSTRFCFVEVARIAKPGRSDVFTYHVVRYMGFDVCIEPVVFDGTCVIKVDEYLLKQSNSTAGHWLKLMQLKGFLSENARRS